MAPDLGKSGGKGRSGLPTGKGEQRLRPALRGADSHAGDRKSAAAREELRMSMGRRRASLGRLGGAVGVRSGGLDPSRSAPFARRGMGHGPRRVPGVAGDSPEAAGPGRAGPGRAAPGAGGGRGSLAQAEPTLTAAASGPPHTPPPGHTTPPPPPTVSAPAPPSRPGLPPPLSPSLGAVTQRPRGPDGCQ